MAAFLKEIEKFYGTKEKNRQGEDLETFLEHYDPRKYETPSCTTDAVIFSITGELLEVNQLKVLLVRRSNHPSIGFWALPGGFAEMRENLEDTARRELEEETGVKDLPLEQFAVYGDYDRDPRTRVITTAYLSLVNEQDITVRAGDDAADAAWCSLCLKEKEVHTGEVSRKVWQLHVSNEEKGMDTRAEVSGAHRRRDCSRSRGDHCTGNVYSGRPPFRKEIKRQKSTGIGSVKKYLPIPVFYDFFCFFRLLEIYAINPRQPSAISIQITKIVVPCGRNMS